MTERSDLAALKELALKAKEQVYPIDLPEHFAVITDVWEYTKAASPDVILEMISCLEKCKKALTVIAKEVDIAPTLCKKWAVETLEELDNDS